MVEPELLISRILSLSTALPSLLVNIGTFNCVWQRYSARSLQTAVLISTAVAMVVDCLILFAVSNWFVDPTWSLWGPVTVGLCIVKRLYSVVPVHMNFLRCTAISTMRAKSWKHYAWSYTVFYTVLCLLASALHVWAYSAGGWVSRKAWYEPTYKFYRAADVAAIVSYASIALYTDAMYLSISRNNPHISQRYVTIKQFHNHGITTMQEVVVLLVVLVPLFLGIFNPLVASAPYNEQFLLALIAQNAIYSVKAMAVLSGDELSDPTTTTPITSKFPMASVVTAGNTKPAWPSVGAVPSTNGGGGNAGSRSVQFAAPPATARAGIGAGSYSETGSKAVAAASLTEPVPNAYYRQQASATHSAPAEPEYSAPGWRTPGDWKSPDIESGGAPPRKASSRY
ncbi:hypothetical protein GGF32_008632 [Allomyces javanicus]|nr:hypothetical protein GGF32_008632 [Allomyces javanicus]